MTAFFRWPKNENRTGLRVAPFFVNAKHCYETISPRSKP